MSAYKNKPVDDYGKPMSDEAYYRAQCLLARLLLNVEARKANKSA